MPIIRSLAPSGQSRCAIAAEPVPFWSMEDKRKTWYFEILIEGYSMKTPPTIPPAAVIGLVTQNFNKSHMPGWEVHSFGWHGDDGKIFDASSYGVDLIADPNDISKSTTFSAGDVVGLGITRPYWDKEAGVARAPLMFRTKNGEFMGYLPSFLLRSYSFDSPKMFPAIGLDIPGKITVNFDGCRGVPFVFDLSTLPNYPAPSNLVLHRDTIRSCFGFSSDEEDASESESDERTYSWTASSTPTESDDDDDYDMGHSGDEFRSPIHISQEQAMQMVSNSTNSEENSRKRN
eukprot:TRINITY_DN3229_c0_g2_i1.p1 TRINITY_DN3229_c0_g2~~TRINITY_DN3229_c0_g2_i1.p1  ORF type:complete len:289 (+),score=48.05 TRINITY_DN3229_c0_g2_i1:625-1491(+)